MNSIGVTETKTFLLSHDDHEFRKMIYLFCMYWYLHISVYNRVYRSMLSLPRSWSHRSCSKYCFKERNNHVKTLTLRIIWLMKGCWKRQYKCTWANQGEYTKKLHKVSSGRSIGNDKGSLLLLWVRNKVWDNVAHKQAAVIHDDQQVITTSHQPHPHHLSPPDLAA